LTRLHRPESYVCCSGVRVDLVVEGFHRSLQRIDLSIDYRYCLVEDGNGVVRGSHAMTELAHVKLNCREVLLNVRHIRFYSGSPGFHETLAVLALKERAVSFVAAPASTAVSLRLRGVFARWESSSTDFRLTKVR
jgi:hypothetical protein